MEGVDEVTPDSSADERASWIKAAIERLDGRADEDQRYEIVSRCAHVFSDERIEELRAICEKNNDIDEVLRAMRADPDNWYAEPRREGNVIYARKNPYDPKGYEGATSEAERKRHYCHCPMVRGKMDEIPPTFCYCGAS